MIHPNYATKICMTRGQEGHVVGWQSKTGSKVHIEGLPENVVPVYPTTNSIQVYLPNNDWYHISRAQVEVLVNFTMTDFASQGKTRLYNVTDLNNLSNHQAYYTALSRSAMACFDVRKISGGCSRALSQEFQELELLDEITSLMYTSKLLAMICSDTRNNLIQAFCKWKGLQYVPRFVRPAIQWSK
ncbi:hypothetical protein BYT27DRAFT_7222963 [Phlegmacium glaucopus]|nr:hypothetical protein BYT27DRAFT_7222963 [Phlegmacium glaucopus]